MNWTLCSDVVHLFIHWTFVLVLTTLSTWLCLFLRITIS
jgi:hypothetical protein